MKKQSIRLYPAVVLALAVVFVAVLSAPVYAVEENEDVTTTTVTTEEENEDESSSSSRAEIAEKKRAEVQKRREAAEAKVTAKREEVQVRLESKKLEMCQKRESKVQGIMERIAERGERQIAVFTKIADRTEAFYAEKQLSLTNYDELTTAVDDAKLAAEAQVAATKAISVDFDCEGENPLGVAEAFKASLEEQKAALKAYKTAVKNLIVGVKSVASTTESETETENETSETTNSTTNTTDEGAAN